MGNIVGEGFDQIIIDQINQRQKIYGSINRNNEILNYINNKTGWCRLVSSVDVVTSPENRNLPNNGVNLAKNFILFNGTSFQGNQQRGGIWPGTDNPSFNNYAYGMGGTEFGLRPMPGITQATIKTETRGSLKTATVNIKANNREQFDIIDILYLRLGYTMLLEWGSSSYFRNNGFYEPNNPNSLVNDFLNPGTAGTPPPTGTTDTSFNYATYPRIIKEKRNSSFGNYDALIGKVVNFNWTFTKDGTYDITVILRSMGDVIESLKTNALSPGGASVDAGVSGTAGASGTAGTTSPTPPAPSPEEIIKSFVNVHSIGTKFYQLQQQLSKVIRIQGSKTDIGDFTKSIIAFKQEYEGIDTQYYISLGYFLKFIEKKIIPYVDNPQVALLNIDTDVDSNIIYLQSRQISTNPGICTFNITFKTPNTTIKFAPDCDPFDTSIDSSKNRYGKIMNAYFNMSWILTTMDNLKNDDGKVSLFDLLEAICKGWNKATGNFSKLEPTVDAEENIIKIIDEVSLPDRNSWLNKQAKSTATAFFNIYGLYPNKNPELQTAGFIKDLSFNTTVPPNLATMITIGATSQGYIVGQDSTALSRMNAGLVDRFKKTIKTHGDNDKANTGSLNHNYKNALSAFNIFVRDLGSVNGGTPTWNQEAITNFSNTAVTFYEYDQAKQTLEAAGGFDSTAAGALAQTNYVFPITASASPNIGFLPFDLQLKMDGLSGMKIYQRYEIDTTYLPANYPKSLEFLIKSITNTIQNNEWTTTIESIAIPKNPFGSVLGENAIESASSRDNNRGTGNLNAVRANSSLRQIILNAGYNENSPEYRFALAIGTKEGWNATANGGVGSRSYRNNNPGNLDLSENLKSIDSNVALENNPYGKNRFAHFTTAELGIKALVESKIKRWGLGNMPVTEGNQNLIVNKKGGKKWVKNTPPTLAQFVYTFAPPNENNTEKYIQDLILSLSQIQPKITRNTLVKNLFA
jgi:hypothetical protein